MDLSSALVRGYRLYRTNPLFRATTNAAASGVKNMAIAGMKRYKTTRRKPTASAHHTKRRMLSRSAAGTNPTPIITQQHDVKIQGKRRRKGKRKVRWNKFVRRVNKAVNSNLRTHTIVEAHTGFSLSPISGTAILQNPYIATLTGTNNTRLCQIGDVQSGTYRYAQNVAEQSPTTTTTTPGRQALDRQLVYTITLAQLNISVKNLSLVPITFDIYEMLAAQNITNILYRTAREAWTQSLVDSNTFDPLTGQGQVATDSGATPYQSPLLTKYWKTIKRTRTSIPSGQNFNYTMFGWKGFVNTAKHDGKYASKGITKDLILVSNPTYNSDTVPAVPQWTAEVTKIFHIKLPNMSGVQTTYTGTYTY